MNQPAQQPQTPPNSYQPPAGQPQQPQWEQPQSIPNMPPQVAPQSQPQPQPVYQQPQQVIRPPEANGTSFIPDAKTKEILDRTYPETVNAFINLAIKKYSEDTDYAAYFVKEEYKAIAEEAQVEAKPKTTETKSPAAEAGFASW